MKKIVLFAVVALFIVFNFNALYASDKKSKSVVFEVDMDCQSCVNKIKNNISYEKGVMDLNVSLENKEVKIEFRTDKTSEGKLIEAFKKIGYTAKVKDQKEKTMEEKVKEEKN
jgi:periplasmic mercuric ion binding protein